MDSLLLEIGTEEIPSSYISPALKGLSVNLVNQFLLFRIKHGDVKTFGTPRRLAVIVENVALEQSMVVDEIFGPSVKIAFNADGSYNIPAIKFAKKVGVLLNELEICETKKGSYVVVRKDACVQKTKILLTTILPEVVLNIPFPKKMRWSDLSIKFARPIHTIVSVLGCEIIRFTIGNKIKSGRDSIGHGVMNFDKVPILNSRDYLRNMKNSNIIVDIDERRSIILESIKKIVGNLGGNLLFDDDLLDVVSNLVEFPVVSIGKFDESFLSMPKDILITVMRNYQKYFSIVNESNELLPAFVVVNNTQAKDMELVVAGHEKVLNSRLMDARFFYDCDVKVKMDFWVEKLKKVVFQIKLGSVYDKTIRIKAIAFYLSNIFFPELVNSVVRAAYLCKADLVSSIVNEFPNLQGTMGSIYARLEGESNEVSCSIREQYYPVKSGDVLPGTKIGSILAIADKIDSICGCFLLGFTPNGDSDPYALRRKSIGILRIIRKMKFNLSLLSLVENSIMQFSIKDDQNFIKITNEVYNFLRNRIFYLFSNECGSNEVVRAVLSVSFDNIIDIEMRILFLNKFKNTKNFEILMLMFKRIWNILRKVDFLSRDISENLFSDSSEHNLYLIFCEVEEKVDNFLKNNSIDKAFETIMLLCKPVDIFFDSIMVMDSNKRIRYNRLALLSAISVFLCKIVDFSKISI